MRALVCDIAGKRLLVDIRGVREVVAPGPLTPVPTAPPEFRGLTQVRGHILPVIDLGVALGLRAMPAVPSPRFVEVESDGARVLLDAGEVAEMRDVEGDPGGAEVVDVPALLAASTARVRAAAETR